MAYVTRAMRDRARDAAYSKQTCECGHLLMNHHELRPSYSLVDGVIVTTDHPDYRPFEFHCDDPACGCVRTERGNFA